MTPDFAVRANLMYDQHDVAGRDFADSERWGGLISATGKPSDDVKITLDYYRYRNDATPDWGVPVRDVDNVPVTELGIPRNTWVGMKGLDFFKEQADIGTATVVAKLADGVTLTNRSRVGQSRLDYVATSMEGISRRAPSATAIRRPGSCQSDRAERPSSIPAPSGTTLLPAWRSVARKSTGSATM